MNLIAIDLDGTLLADNGTITQANRDAVHEAQKNNIIVISTGRSFHDAYDILQKADIHCPIIAGNGGLIYDSEEILQQWVIPLEKLGEIMNMIETYGLYYEIYTNKGVLMLEEGRYKLYNELKSLETQTAGQTASKNINIQSSQHGIVYVSDFHTQDYSTLDPYKVFVMSYREKRLKELETQLVGMHGISMTTSGREKLEIAHEHASKGHALKFMAEYFKIPRQKTVAIGDNFNDLSMFQATGTGIAMANAEQEVKDQARFTTKHCHDDGVAYALMNYVQS